MTILFLLIPISVVVALGFLGAFFWAVRDGQYDDTRTPSMRVLLEDPGEGRRGHSPPRPTDFKASNR